ncbi:MAG: hypothetical protein ACLUVF_05790 [Adlercreutzia sp.]
MNPDRVLDSFLEMAAIESPSWHEAPMAAYCAEKLAEMGFTVTFDASAAETGSDTGNLIAHCGTVPGRIGFSAHLDTVNLRGHRGGHRAAPYLRRRHLPHGRGRLLGGGDDSLSR